MFCRWPVEISALLVLILLTACGATGTPSPQSSVVDTGLLAPKDTPPKIKYSFLFDTTPPPPPPDTMLAQLPRLPDFVIAPDTMMYRGKAILLARLPYGAGPSHHGNDLTPKEGDFFEEYFAVNARNYIVLTDKMKGMLHIIGPDGKILGAIENLDTLDGPVVFISDSVCVVQTGYAYPETRLNPYFRVIADYPLRETVAVINIFTQSIVGETRLPDVATETAVLPAWHPVSLFLRLERGEADYPTTKWRIGSVPIWEVADPTPGRGYFAAAERVLGTTKPIRMFAATSGLSKSFPYFELTSTGRRIFSPIDGNVGQTADGRLFDIRGDSVRGMSLIGDELVQTEEYADPLPPRDDEHPNGGEIVEIPRVSATGRVFWIYRTPRGVEIYMAEKR